MDIPKIFFPAAPLYYIHFHSRNLFYGGETNAIFYMWLLDKRIGIIDVEFKIVLFAISKQIYQLVRRWIY